METNKNTIKEDLAKIAKLLPHGSFVRLAKKCRCSDEYIRRFFRYHYEITKDNMKILDEASKILAEESSITEVAQNKTTKILTDFKPNNAA